MKRFKIYLEAVATVHAENVVEAADGLSTLLSALPPDLCVDAVRIYSCEVDDVEAIGVPSEALS